MNYDENSRRGQARGKQAPCQSVAIEESYFLEVKTQEIPSTYGGSPIPVESLDRAMWRFLYQLENRFSSMPVGVGSCCPTPKLSAARRALGWGTWSKMSEVQPVYTLTHRRPYP